MCKRGRETGPSLLHKTVLLLHYCPRTAQGRRAESSSHGRKTRVTELCCPPPPNSTTPALQCFHSRKVKRTLASGFWQQGHPRGGEDPNWTSFLNGFALPPPPPISPPRHSLQAAEDARPALFQTGEGEKESRQGNYRGSNKMKPWLRRWKERDYLERRGSFKSLFP